MKPSKSGWNLVVLGRWDPMILTPEFMKAHVAEGEVTVEVPSHARLPPRLSFDGVSTLVVEGRLVMTPAKPSRAGLHQAEGVFVKVLELLPHTPVSGTGVNLQWELPLEGAVAATLSHADDEALRSAGLTPASVVVRRRLAATGRTMNLTVETGTGSGAEGGGEKLVGSESTARVSVNHHADTEGAAAAKKALLGQTAGLLDEAEGLVKRLYGA